MKSKILIVAGLVLLSFAFMGQIVTTSGIGNAVSLGSATYTAGTTDTVKWFREKGVVGLAFGIYASDSVQIKNVIVKRVVNGSIVTIPAVAVADTIAGAAVSGTVPAGADSAADAASFVHSVTMTPYVDEYWFLVKYDATTLGHTYNNAIDTNTVRYEVIKQFNSN